MLALILLIVALVLFILGALSFPSGVRVNLVALGLAFLTAALIVPTIHGG